METVHAIPYCQMSLLMAADAHLLVAYGYALWLSL